MFGEVKYNKIKTKTEFTSKAEIARNNEFVSIYSEAWRETE